MIGAAVAAVVVVVGIVGLIIARPWDSKDEPPTVNAALPTSVAAEGRPLGETNGAPPSEPLRKSVPLVFLQEPMDDFAGRPAGTLHGPLLRELARQAFLVAARDGLGLATRDGVLLEPAPNDLPPGNQFHLASQLRPGAPMQLTIHQGVGDPSGPGTQLTVKGDSTRMPGDIRQWLVACEEQSRTTLLALLRQEGFGDRPIPAAGTAEIPAEIEERLGRMTFTEQFAAVRQLHALIRSNGQSPALIAGLVRAYSHLGLLTEQLFGQSHKVYKARALLYAQRLIGRKIDDPLGHYARAYAWAAVGRQDDALRDLTNAEAVRKLANGKVPSWASTIDAYCRFDDDALKKVAEAGAGHGQLATMLRFIASECLIAVQFVHQRGEETLRALPDCHRVHAALANFGGVGSLHVTTVANIDQFTRGVPRLVTAVPGLPAAAAELARDGAKEPQLWAALVEAGRAEAPGAEPSWSALGRWGQESRMLQFAARAYFMQYVWSVPVGEFAAKFAPLLKEHRYARLVEFYSLDRVRQIEQRRAVLEALPLRDIDFRHGLVTVLFNMDHKTYAAGVAPRISAASDMTYHDFLNRLQRIAEDHWSPWSESALIVASHSPVARALSIKSDQAWPRVQGQAEAWEKAAQHPDPLRSLARRYLTLNRQEDAERCLRRAVALSPDSSAYRTLADLYQQRGQEEKWLQTMEEVLKHPDTGLGHSNTRVRIARHFMAKGDHRRAEPYAAAAAESYAGDAMRCAVECYEALQEWDKAELWVRRESERYPEQAGRWYYWCKRHGRGEAAAAGHLIEAVGRRDPNAGPPGAADLTRLATYFDMEGRSREAAVKYLESHQRGNSPVVLLLAAFAFDRAGDRADRDAALDKFPDDAEETPIARLMKATFARGAKAPINEKELEQALARPGAKSWPAYCAGRLLARQGQAKAATEMFESCLRPTKDVGSNSLSAMTAVELRSLNGGKPTKVSS